VIAVAVDAVVSVIVVVVMGTGTKKGDERNDGRGYSSQNTSRIPTSEYRIMDAKTIK
jgi:hypothetical protein